MSWEIRHGHALASLREMPDESVQMVATSPPYWGLRDYGDSGQAWPAVSYAPMPGLPELTIPASVEPLGLERDPWAYVGHLVEIFREVRRVLRRDGVLFLNLGDSYMGARSPGARNKDASGVVRPKHERRCEVCGGPFIAGWGQRFCSQRCGGQDNSKRKDRGLHPKDLVGIPWRAAYALQADGWFLRSDCIWAKLNPMPESVRDRPTKSHEYVFLLSKGPRYFWDQEAVKRAHVRIDSHTGPTMGRAARESQGGLMRTTPVGRNCGMPPGGRNLRTVWTIPTQPYPGAHFAVWPPALAERCIRAGSAVGDVVLDPFSGSGTTGLTAARLGRDYIGLEQSAEYVRLSRQRIADALGIDRATLEQLGDEAPASVQLGMFG